MLTTNDNAPRQALAPPHGAGACKHGRRPRTLLKAPRKPVLSPELQREVDAREYEALVRQAIQSGKGLPYQDQRRLQEVAHRLNKTRSSVEPDFFNTAASSGAFRDPGHRPAGKHIVTFRHEVVASLLVYGYSRQRTIVFSGEQWGLGEDSADDYIRNARKILAKHSERNLRLQQALVSARLDHAYEVAHEQRDPNAMVKSAMAMAELYGLMAAQRAELTGAEGGPIETAVLDMPEKKPGITQAEYEALHPEEFANGQEDHSPTTDREGQ